jgi:hypothetical protein
MMIYYYQQANFYMMQAPKNRFNINNIILLIIYIVSKLIV